MTKKCGSIYCIGRNYQDHAKELNNEIPTKPVVFLKSAASLRGLEPSPMAFADERFHHEIELVLKIGKNIRLGETINVEEAVSHLALGLDLTRREIQTELKSKGLPWTLAKSFAGSAVIGSLVKFDAKIKFSDIDFSLTVNDVLKQEGHTRDMMFDVSYLLDYLASFQELNEGDLIFTGTPKGVGPIEVGDTFVFESRALKIKEHGKI